MTNEYKEIENNSYFNSSKTPESLCSECKNEIAVNQNEDEDTLSKSYCSSCKSEVVVDEAQDGGILMKFFHEKTVCSSCKNKTVANENQNLEPVDKNSSDSEQLLNELFAEGLNGDEELLRATQSLSQISLGYPVEKEENQSNDPIHLVEHNPVEKEENQSNDPTHLVEHNCSSNGTNTNEHDTNHGENDVFLHHNQDEELNMIEIGEKDLAFQHCDDNAIDNIFENFNNEPVRKDFCDQEVQTEEEGCNKENEPIWDPEFLCGPELEKIDNAIREATITPASKCKRKLNFDDIDSHFTVAKKSKDVSKPNYNAMVSVKLNREKYLADLANDLYELSSYLNDIGKAMNVKETNNKTSVKIPTAPKFVGYDVQFDCLNQSRFPKLPINVENSDSSKFSGSNETLNSKQRVKASSKKISNGALTLKNAKGMSNNRGVGIPKKSFYQTTLKEAFSYGKENKKIENSNTNSTKSVNKTNSTIKVNNINEDQKSLDSTSMYDFNPLRASTFTKGK